MLNTDPKDNVSESDKKDTVETFSEDKKYSEKTEDEDNGSDYESRTEREGK